MNEWLKPNEGTVDRGLRMTLGVALLLGGGAALNWSWLGLVGLVGLVPLVTGAIGSCPIYTALGIRTDHAAA